MGKKNTENKNQFKLSEKSSFKVNALISFKIIGYKLYSKLFSNELKKPKNKQMKKNYILQKLKEKQNTETKKKRK